MAIYPLANVKASEQKKVLQPSVKFFWWVEASIGGRKLQKAAYNAFNRSLGLFRESYVGAKNWFSH